MFPYSILVSADQYLSGQYLSRQYLKCLLLGDKNDDEDSAKVLLFTNELQEINETIEHMKMNIIEIMNYCKKNPE